MPFCVMCGQAISDEQRFCTNCGTLNAAAPGAQENTAAAPPVIEQPAQEQPAVEGFEEAKAEAAVEAFEEKAEPAVETFEEKAEPPVEVQAYEARPQAEPAAVPDEAQLAANAARIEAEARARAERSQAEERARAAQQERQYYQNNWTPPVTEQPFNIESIPKKYRPVSAWAYFGLQILYAIPLAGLVCWIICCVNGFGNENIKRYARSGLISLILAVAVIILLLILVAVGGLAFSAGNIIDNIWSVVGAL